MNWIDYLESKFGRFAIPGLVRIIVGFNALVFVLSLINKNFLSLLVFDRDLILSGQVWRLLTYIFIPALGDSWLMPDYLWLVFWLMFLWMLGEGLEQAWGAFKLNLFYLLGMIGTTISVFVFGANSASVTLNMSLLFAFATIYPDFQILLFLIIPVRIKWLAWFSFGLLMFSMAGSSLALKMGVLVSFLNYALFFGPQLWRQGMQRKAVAARRAEFESKHRAETEALHQCVTCRRTELSDPSLEFRVSKDGNEYCVDHLPSRSSDKKGVAELL